MTVRSDGRVAVRKWVGGKVSGWLKDGETVFVRWMGGGWAVTARGYVMTDFLEDIGNDDD